MNELPKAFSNITRIKILSCLNGKTENVMDLVKKCGISQSAVSQHLKKLKDLGVVDCSVSGKERLYRLKYREAGDIAKRIIKLIKK
ncbi:MAG: metalloregulator ArsR/SmtB family transcription factor [Patescibacteria group bacterium]|nr:metalloregulator ArsR/SmtB family transcription factor [Patescibacteria group bacterium]